MTGGARPDTFVGRSTPLAEFADAVGVARSGLATVVLIGGDAGIGKSTFVAEASRRSDIELFVARCPPQGGDAIPLAALADLVRQVRRRVPEGDVAALAPLLTWLSPTGTEPSSIETGRLFSSALDLLSALAEGAGAVVAFEDLHWADTETWSLFEYVVRNVDAQPAVIVGTFRTEELNSDPARRRRLAELSRLPIVRRVALPALDRSEIAEHVGALIGRTAPAPLVDAIAARGQGNPFFTEQLVVAHLAGEQLPALLSDLLTSELATVDDAGRHVLGAIATIGRDTTHEFLAKVTDVDGDALEVALQATIDAQLLVVDLSSDRYRFRHALIGEVAYRELLPSQRTRLHARVAAALRDQPAPALSRADRAGELAFHLDRAGDQEGAFFASLAAADAAGALAPGAARSAPTGSATGPE